MTQSSWSRGTQRRLPGTNWWAITHRLRAARTTRLWLKDRCRSNWQSQSFLICFFPEDALPVTPEIGWEFAESWVLGALLVTPTQKFYRFARFWNYGVSKIDFAIVWLRDVRKSGFTKIEFFRLCYCVADGFARNGVTGRACSHTFTYQNRGVYFGMLCYTLLYFGILCYVNHEKKAACTILLT